MTGGPSGVGTFSSIQSRTGTSISGGSCLMLKWWHGPGTETIGRRTLGRRRAKVCAGEAFPGGPGLGARPARRLRVDRRLFGLDRGQCPSARTEAEAEAREAEALGRADAQDRAWNRTILPQRSRGVR